MSDPALGAEKPDTKDVKLVATWLWGVKSSGHSTDMYEPGRYLADVPLHERKHGLVFTCYQRLLMEKSLMDFDDILVLVSSEHLHDKLCSRTPRHALAITLMDQLPGITRKGALSKLDVGLRTSSVSGSHCRTAWPVFMDVCRLCASAQAVTISGMSQRSCAQAVKVLTDGSILREVQGEVQYLLVDEFQDSNPVQVTSPE